MLSGNLKQSYSADYSLLSKDIASVRCRITLMISWYNAKDARTGENIIFHSSSLSLYSLMPHIYVPFLLQMVFGLCVEHWFG